MDRILTARVGRRNRFRSRSIGAAAGALAASGAATPASATVIFDFAISHSPDFSFDLTGDVSSQIDLFTLTGMMGEFDLGLDAPAGMGMMDPGSTVQLSVFDAGMGMDDFLSLLTPGDTVGGTLDFQSQALLVDSSQTSPGWTPGDIGYAGFTFDPGSGPLYGWLRVRFESDATNFTVLGWAYESDVGTDIVVPEPGLALLLGLGIAGVAMGWKHRRAADPPPTD